MYVCNNEACSCHHCCTGKAIIITNSLSVCVCGLWYPTWNTHAPYCHLWPAALYNIFPHYLTNGTIFKKKVIDLKMCFDYLCNFCLKHFSFKAELSGIWSKMYIGLYVQYLLCLSDFNGNWILLYPPPQKKTNIKVHKDSSRGSRVVPRGWTDRQTQWT